MARGDALGGGEYVCVVEEARGGEVWSDSSPEYRRAEGLRGQNCSSLVAPGMWRLGAKREESLAFKRTSS